MAKIICPICDEELGNSLDEVPEKCPICDTRRHEILQEIQEQEAPANAMMPQLMLDGNLESISSNFSFQPTLEETERAPEPNFGFQPIEEKKTIADEWDNFDPNQNIEPGLSSEWQSFSADTPLLETKSTFEEDDEEERIHIREPKIVEEVPLTQIETQIATEHALDLEPNQDFFPKDQVIFKEATLTVEKVEEQKPVIVETPTKPISQPIDPSRPTKSGASALECLPFGYKYCPICNEIFEKTDPNIVCTQKHALEVVDKGFPPSDYLILYNNERKAITYFRLDRAGSIFLGRSSERGSARDIDLSLAWKHYYQRHCTDEETFKDRMRLLKGISRKHALVRYSQEDQKYLLFHLSDNNYTTVQFPDGEKRIRTPKNRKKIELQPDTTLSLGNQKDFIILKYKVISK
ncbi:MAG TPA: FHA domain-containing protein [Planctomycetota bacterium]|nr:FHA domain-containing protein [Planctomycetota bacterium]